jgi:hypothetical protein
LNLFEAINQAAAGKTIVSNLGKSYTSEELGPIYCGAHYACFATAGTTENERKGIWSLDGGSTN